MTPTPNRQSLRRGWLILLVALAVVALGVGFAGANARARAVLTRGWADPARDPNLPYHVPLPGVNVELTRYPPAQLDAELAAMQRAGFVWLRQTFAWERIEPVQGRYQFGLYDSIVQAVARYPDLRLVAVLDTTPDWARRPEAADRLFSPPASMAAFADFAAALAARYGDVIDVYQVWDEPNLYTHWGGFEPSPADYAALLKAVYPVLKGWDRDAEATVIMAGLAPTVETGGHNLNEVTFLNGVYAAGAGDSFDAVAGKPYGFDFPPDDRTVDPYRLNFARIILLRETLLAHGDGHKAVWGSHFGWNSLPAGWTGAPSIWGQVSAEAQRDYTRRAYQRAETEWPWLGGLILASWEPDAPADDPHQGFRVREKAAAWFDDGAFFRHEAALPVGKYPATDPALQYTGRWAFGALGADARLTSPDETPPSDGSAHRVNFTFAGTSLGIEVRRAAEVAYLYARVDNVPANALPQVTAGSPVGGGESYIVLRSPTGAEETITVEAANHLGDDVHSADLRLYLGYSRWALAGVGIGSPPDTSAPDQGIALGALLIGLGGLAFAVTALRMRRALERGLRPAVVYARKMSDVLGGLAVSLAAVFSMAITVNQLLPDLLRRDLPAALVAVITVGALALSPALIVTLAALALLWALIYNRPLIGLALVAFWTPFFLAPLDLYLYALPMVELATLMTLSAVLVRGFVIWLTRPERAPNTPFRFHFADYAALAFAGLAVISLVWSAQIGPAARELRIIVIEPLLFYFLLRMGRLTRADWARLVDVLLIGAACMALIGLIAFLFGGEGVTIAEGGSRRLMSVYGSPNNAALYLGRTIPFAVALVLIARDRTRRVASAILALILLAAMVLTQSAGGLLLGMPAGLAVVALLWNVRRGLILTGLMALAVIGLLLFARFIPRLQGALDFSRASSFVRIQLWSSTLTLLGEQPVTGVGLDQFLYAYRSRYILPEAWQEPDLSHPHNLILDFWVRLGLGGLAILAAFQIAFWRNGWQARQALRQDRERFALLAGAMGSMAAFIAHGLVDNSYFVVDLAYLFCFTMAIVTSATGESDESDAPPV